MAKRPGLTNKLRLIGGRHGGRKLSFPDAKGLRPTSDRVRETLFNWLQADVEGSVCLDLFAGSGALGFEAVSRGASRVVFVERVASVVQSLRENTALLRETSVVDVVQSKALSWLEKPIECSFDIIFLDPPFAEHYLDEIINQLAQTSHVSSGTKIYIEREVHQTLPSLPEHWQLLKEKKAGQVLYSLLICGR